TAAACVTSPTRWPRSGANAWSRRIQRPVRTFGVEDMEGPPLSRLWNFRNPSLPWHALALQRSLPLRRHERRANEQSDCNDIILATLPGPPRHLLEFWP